MSVSSCILLREKLIPDRAFDALLAEMQREYNPEPEKKKKGWWPFS